MNQNCERSGEAHPKQWKRRQGQKGVQSLQGNLQNQHDQQFCMPGKFTIS